MATGDRTFGRRVGVGIAAAALALAIGGEATAQYGPRAQPITGLRTGMRYQPALASPFATTRVGGLGTPIGLAPVGGFYGPGLGVGGLYGYGSRFGGFYGPGFGVTRAGFTTVRSGFGLGGFGLGVRSFGGVGLGAPVATSFSLSIGGPGWGLGYPGYGWGLGYPGYGWGLGYPGYGGFVSPGVVGWSSYGPFGIRSIGYGGRVPYPYGTIGSGGLPYGYGGGFFGF